MVGIHDQGGGADEAQLIDGVDKSGAIAYGDERFGDDVGDGT